LDEGKNALRLRFEAETDIILVPHPEHWQQYDFLCRHAGPGPASRK
jgi:hypothetical protein